LEQRKPFDQQGSDGTAPQQPMETNDHTDNAFEADGKRLS
jgi:hypothetical protein